MPTAMYGGNGIWNEQSLIFPTTSKMALMNMLDLARQASDMIPPKMAGYPLMK